MKRERLISLGILVALIFYLVVAFYSLHEPLRLDEVHLTDIATDILANGKMRMSLGHSDHPVYTVVHPPTYNYMLAFAGRLGGFRAESMRILGVFSLLISLGLMVLLVRRTVPASETDMTSCLAILLAVTNPLFLRGSLLVDIDNTILVPTILGLCYLILLLLEKHNSRNTLGWVLGVALSLWVKFLTPLLIVFALAIHRLRWRQPGRIPVEVLLAFVAGAGSFMAGWLWFCHATGTPLWDIFTHQWGAATSQNVATHSLQGLFEKLFVNSANEILWMSPYLAILWLGSLLFEFGFRGSRPRNPSIEFLATTSLVVFFAYVLVGGSSYYFPRYHVPLVPLVCVFIAITLSRFTVRLQIPRLWGSLFAVLLFLYYFLVVRDPLLGFYDQFRAGGAKAALHVLLFQGWYQYLVPLALALLVLWGMNRLRGSKILEVVTLALLLCTLASSMSLDVHQVNVKYSTLYLYGERGIEEAGQQLARWALPHGRLICDDDLVYYGGLTTQSCEFPLTTRAFKEVPYLLQLLRSPDFFAMVLRRTHRSEPVLEDPAVRRILATDYEYREIGSFQLWHRVRRKP